MAQLLSGRVTERVVDAQSEMELSFAEVKAAATGDDWCWSRPRRTGDRASGAPVPLVLQGRERDRKEAATLRRSAENVRRTATRNQQLAARIAQCEQPGFKTLEGDALQERPKIGSYVPSACLIS